MIHRFFAFSLAVTWYLVLCVSTVSAEPPANTQKTITLASALKIAQEALEQSHANGAKNIAVAVVDSAGRTLVLLREDEAPEHPAIAAVRKAWTAANYQSSTKDVLARVKAGKGDDGQLVHTKKSLFLMGGVPLKDGDAFVGAVGVAGNPSGLQDDSVARAAAQAFDQMLKAEGSR